MTAAIGQRWQQMDMLDEAKATLRDIGASGVEWPARQTCKQPPSRENTRAHWAGKLCVDHCHDSTKVRGLLCNDCNLAVGYGKTEAILRAAADYLRDSATE